MLLQLCSILSDAPKGKVPHKCSAWNARAEVEEQFIAPYRIFRVARRIPAPILSAPNLYGPP